MPSTGVSMPHERRATLVTIPGQIFFRVCSDLQRRVGVRSHSKGADTVRQGVTEACRVQLLCRGREGIGVRVRDADCVAKLRIVTV